MLRFSEFRVFLALTLFVSFIGTAVLWKITIPGATNPPDIVLPLDENLFENEGNSGPVYGDSTTLGEHASRASDLTLQDNGTRASPIIGRTGKKAMVVYAISVTDCPKTGDLVAVLDAPAVMAYSINRVSTGRFNYRFVAFVHPGAKRCTTHLAKMGYQVLIRKNPVELTQIKTAQYRRYVQKRGCCEEREFLKLYTYTLGDADVVVSLDPDMSFLNPIDELVEAFLVEDTSSVQSSIATMHNRPLPKRVEFLYTRDYVQMSKFSTNISKFAVQGGFFMVRPNMTNFRTLQRIIQEGNFNGKHSGWGGLHYGGFYGDAQIQGLLSYFYGEFHPYGTAELNPCIYNTMVTVPPLTKKGVCRYGNDTEPCYDCANTHLSDIKFTHHTVCFKPWKCYQLRNFHQLCKDTMGEWFRMRSALERSWGLKVPEDGYLFNQTYGYCIKDPKKKHADYTAMSVDVVQTVL